jgi:hypothetical protein
MFLQVAKSRYLPSEFWQTVGDTLKGTFELHQTYQLISHIKIILESVVTTSKSFL